MENKDDGSYLSTDMSDSIDEMLRGWHDSKSSCDDKECETDQSEFGNMISGLSDYVGAEETKGRDEHEEDYDDGSSLLTGMVEETSDFTQQLLDIDDASRSTVLSLSSDEPPATLEWGTTREVQEMTGMLYTHTAIEISKSEVNPGEWGVFNLKRLPKGTALTVFPGLYKRYHNSHPDIRNGLFEYGVEVPFIRNSRERNNFTWILDAEGWNDDEDGIAHIFNSSHPHLPPPYNTPNVQLHHEQPDNYFDRNARPPLVIAQTLKDITQTGELLTDYHWMLIGVYTPLYEGGNAPLGSCGCQKCDVAVDNILYSYM